MTGVLYFVACVLLALVGAAGVVGARSPIRSAVGLLTCVLGIAGLFLKLHAEFLAAVQLIVYAGAVVVLFVFVIMLLGSEAGGAGRPGSAQLARGVGAVVAAAVALAALLLAAPAEDATVPFAPAAVGFGSVEAVGGQIFGRALVPFELATALLVVAIVGAVAVSRGRGVTRRGAPPPLNPTARLFGGPVHPRDAGRPLGEEDAP